jgi:hypothetical protein
MMKTKHFSASNVQVKDASTGEFEAVFATLGVIDHDGDVITKGAIDDGAQVVISAYGHSVWKGTPPVGTGTIHEVGNTAVVKGRYFLDTSAGRDDFNTVKGLAEAGLGEWSFGLLDVKAEAGEVAGVKANMIKSVRVPEVSPVFIGAGIGTHTTLTKAADGKFSEHLESVLADVNGLTDRAEEVLILRAAKGKTIGVESAELLAQLAASCERLKALIDPAEETTTLDDEANAHDVAANEAAANELARHYQIQGATR